MSGPWTSVVGYVFHSLPWYNTTRIGTGSWELPDSSEPSYYFNILLKSLNVEKRPFSPVRMSRISKTLATYDIERMWITYQPLHIKVSWRRVTIHTYVPFSWIGKCL